MDRIDFNKMKAKCLARTKLKQQSLGKYVNSEIKNIKDTFKVKGFNLKEYRINFTRKTANDDDKKDQSSIINENMLKIMDSEGFINLSKYVLEDETITYEKQIDTLLYRNKQDLKNIYVDGTSCCGKSTMISCLSEHRLFKIKNVYNGNVKFYNFDPLLSTDYFVRGILLNNNCRGMCFDRSPISNLAYQIVYYLMFGVLDKRKTMFGNCMEYIKIYNLEYMLRYMKSQKLSIIIIIDSDIDGVRCRMTNRAKPKDIKRNYYRYVIFQNIAFSVLSYLCDIPCIDLNYFRIKFNISTKDVLDYIQKTYIEKLNCIVLKKGDICFSNYNVKTTSYFENHMSSLVLHKR